MSESLPTQAAHCANCGHPLTGNFCAQCGQQDKEVRRPFFYFLQELLRVVFELDGRAYRTVFYLLTRPGFLTREFFQGRRATYTPPLRLFLIISIGFFLLVGVVTSIQSMRAELVEASMEEASAAVSAQSTTNETAVDAGAPFLALNGDGTTEENLEEIRTVINQIRLPFLSEQRNDNLNRILVAQTEANLQEVMDDPQEFFLGSLEYITVFMLLMMPILALMQRILFLLSRHYYIEHLVLTLHNHAFLIFAFFVTLLLGLIADLEIAYLSATFNLLNTALGIWMFLYLYLSLKFYFGRGYMLTALIFIITSILYAAVLAMGIAVFAILLFLFS